MRLVANFFSDNFIVQNHFRDRLSSWQLEGRISSEKSLWSDTLSTRAKFIFFLLSISYNYSEWIFFVCILVSFFISDSISSYWLLALIISLNMLFDSKEFLISSWHMQSIFLLNYVKINLLSIILFSYFFSS